MKGRDNTTSAATLAIRAKLKALILIAQHPSSKNKDGQPPYAYARDYQDPGLLPGEGRREAIKRRIAALQTERQEIMAILREREEEGERDKEQTM